LKPAAAAAIVLLGAAGCFAPAIRPVEMADFGHVSLTAGFLFPEANANGNDFEYSALAAVGVAPHLQLEVSGAMDSGDSSQGGIPFNWALGAGLRGGVPIGDGADYQIQVAALYEWADASLTRAGLCSSGSTSTTRGSRETLEIGPTYEDVDRTFAIGFWLDVALGEMNEVSTGSLAGLGLPLDVGARIGVQARPWAPDIMWLSLLFDLEFAYPVVDFNGAVTSTSGFEDSSQTWTALNAALNVAF
jgi:hypothetical protein